MEVGGKGVVSRYRVYLNQTDAGGVVYYGNYLKYFEQARFDYFEALGIDEAEGAFGDRKTAYAVRNVTASYNAPLCVGDTARVETRIVSRRMVKLTVAFSIFNDDTHQLCSEGTLELVYVNLKTRKPTSVPKHVSKIIDENVWDIAL